MGNTCCKDDLVVPGDANAGRPNRRPEPVQCFICSDDGCARYLQCDSGHVICSDCFNNQVSAWSDPVLGACGDVQILSISRREDLLGSITCCNGSCACRFSCSVIVRFLAGSPHLQKYRRGCVHQREKYEAVVRPQPPVMMLRERSEREVFVEEELLTLRCPKCRTAFHDFDGCFAVVCANCREYFCAWCLRVHGNSEQVHRHVAQCKQNPLPNKSVWGSLEQFNRYHEERKANQVEAFLMKEKDESLSRRVMPAITTAFGRFRANTVKARASFFDKKNPTPPQRKRGETAHEPKRHLLYEVPRPLAQPAVPNPVEPRRILVPR